MTLRFRNTLGGELEPFEPIDAANVRMYTCGPTVYAPAHVGNFRSFLFADLTRRYLAWKGYPVTWVMNITDVDDKIIRDAAAAGVTIGRADGGPHGGLPGRAAPAAGDDARCPAARHGPHPGHGPAHRHAPGTRSCVSDRRRLDLLPHRVLAGVRHAGASRPDPAASGGAGRGGRVQQGRCARLRALEGRPAGRAQLVDRDRRGSPRLAHRMLGHEHALPGYQLRYPHRWRRPRVPPSRG